MVLVVQRCELIVYGDAASWSKLHIHSEFSSSSASNTNEMPIISGSVVVIASSIQADLACGSSAHGQTDSQLNIFLLLCLYICSMYYVRYIEYKYCSARKLDLMDTSNPPQADVDREQQKHKYKILRLVSRNVNVSRKFFIPASRFLSHTHKFFHALAKRKRFAEHFHSHV